MSRSVGFCMCLTSIVTLEIHHNFFYNTVRYNTVLDIKQFKDGPQKCIDYIEK